jgi:replicative DNA helicase
MSAVQYLDRFACYMASVDYFDVQDGKFTDTQERHLNAAAHIITKLPIVVDEYGSQPIDRIRANIELHDPELIVVDYLQYLSADDGRGNRNQQVGQISRDLARLKSDYNLPVVIAAQLNRASEHRGKDSEPILSDLRDSGELEQDADVVLMLHRPDMNDPDVGPEHEDVRILCRKNRMGQLWHTNLKFVPGQQWLTDKYDAVTGVGMVG